ncbi:MAG TPA: hypothetical protein EYN64_03430, partial [Flavobacteriales bacterium]|nr:hypothetical protein [Flavobacteriales bacterium]
MKHLLIIPLLFLSPYLFSQTIYEGTHISIGHEDNYSISLPSNPIWADDYLISGTYWPVTIFTDPTTYYSRLKRVDVVGDIMWDYDYQFYGAAGTPMYNRTLHVDESEYGSGSSALCVGYVDNVTKNALIYGVNTVGGIVEANELVNVEGPDVDHEEFVHADEVSGANIIYPGWIVVGNTKSGLPGANDRSVLLSYISVTGAVLWTRLLGSPIDSPGTSDDWDYGSNVLHIPDYGFFVSGSGNIYDPNSMTYKQGALATLIHYDGTIMWHQIYVHSTLADNTVSASAFYDETNGLIFQIANGQGDPTFLENGFSLNAFKVTSGESFPEFRRNFHLDNTPLKGMTVQPSQSFDNIVVSGFLDMPSPPSGANAWPNGLVDSDRPPFLMEFSRLRDTVSTVIWNKVYPVSSTGYGAVTFDDYELQSNVNQPLFYHPEMLTQNVDSGSYTLVGLRQGYAVDNMFDAVFDLEFIHGDVHGDALCDEVELNIIEVVTQMQYTSNPINVLKYYQLMPLESDQVTNSPPNIPCDICDPDLTMTITADCDAATISLLYTGDILDICLSINWGDGTIEVVPAATTLTHIFAPGFIGGDVCVTSFCCGFSGIGSPMDFNCLPIPLPADCDCGHCHPFVSVCQNDFYSSAVQLDDPSADPLSELTIGILLLFPDCAGGCATAPYSVHVTLGSFITSYFGGCLDNHSIEYYINGVLVGAQSCGSYAPIDLPVSATGNHTLKVVLTNCSNPACVDTRLTEFSVGNCVPPETPRFKIVDNSPSESMCGSIFNCSRYLSPLTQPAACMDISWIVDGEEIPGGFYSLGRCFSWGCHTVQMKMFCIDDPTVFTLSEPQTFCCGLIEIGPIVLWDTSPEWLPYYYPLSAEIDSSCNLLIEIGSPLAEIGVSN